jgi:hypothetical protein
MSFKQEVSKLLAEFDGDLKALEVKIHDAFDRQAPIATPEQPSSPPEAVAETPVQS